MPKRMRDAHLVIIERDNPLDADMAGCKAAAAATAIGTGVGKIDCRRAQRGRLNMQISGNVIALAAHWRGGLV